MKSSLIESLNESGYSDLALAVSGQKLVIAGIGDLFQDKISELFDNLENELTNQLEKDIKEACKKVGIEYSHGERETYTVDKKKGEIHISWSFSLFGSDVWDYNTGDWAIDYAEFKKRYSNRLEKLYASLKDILNVSDFDLTNIHLNQGQYIITERLFDGVGNIYSVYVTLHF